MPLQGRPFESNILLYSGGSPVTGVVPADVSVSYRKTGESSLSTLPLATSNWIEVGNGLYILVFSGSDMDTLGSYYYEVSGGSFDNLVKETEVVPVPVGSLVTTTTCIVSGNISELGGSPGFTREITFRLAKRPSTNSGAFVLAEQVSTVPDINGSFTVELVRGVKVIASIPSAGVKHTIVIPDQGTANLIDLLPPIDNIP